MVAEYVKDPRMSRHMGIGRRLAPLLDGDQRLAQLLYALLFSLPGSPVIYYGDELLMGDNLYLGDRDSVRTPMQWSPTATADSPGRLRPALPAAADGPRLRLRVGQRRGPAAQPGSFLHWIRSILQTAGASRCSAPELRVVPCANPSVLAYVRSGEVVDILSWNEARPWPVGGARRPAGHWTGAIPAVLARTVPAGNEGEGDEVVHRHQAVLCVHNLSRFAQPAELALAKWAGSTPYEVLGRVPFPGHHRRALRRDPAALRVPVVRPRSSRRRRAE